MEGLFEIEDPLLVTFTNRLAFSNKGERKRICIRDNKIAMVDVHRVSRDGRASLTLCKGEKQCGYCKRGYLPTRRYGLRVFEYVKVEGKIDLCLIPWVFGQDKLDVLIKFVKKGRPFRKTDWMLTCVNPKFQGFKIVPAAKCLWVENASLRARATELSKAVKVSGLVVLKGLVDGALPDLEGGKREKQRYDAPPEPQHPDVGKTKADKVESVSETKPEPEKEPEKPEAEIDVDEMLDGGSEEELGEDDVLAEDWQSELDQILEGT